MSDNDIRRSVSHDAPYRAGSYNFDATSHAANEVKERERSEKSARRGYTALTFVLCAAKIFLISTLQGSMTLFRDNVDEPNMQFRKSFFFGTIITGNIIDNVHSPKLIAIVLQIWLGLNWLCSAWQVNIAIKNNCEFVNSIAASGDMAQILGSGIVLINTLQVYNWFDKRYISIALTGYFCTQFVGYSLPITYIKECQWVAHPIYYMTFGVGMICLGVLDQWLFFFNPLQKNIFLDKAEADRRRDDIYRRKATMSELQD